MDRRYAMARTGPGAFAPPPAALAPKDVSGSTIGLDTLMTPETWLACAAYLGMLFSPQLGQPGPMIMLAAGAVLLMRTPANLANGLRIHWGMLIYPLYCLMSVFWSYAPGATLRAGLELFVTYLFVFQITQEKRRGAIITGIFLAFLAYNFVALTFGHKVTVGNLGGKAFSGLNGGKNLQADIATLGLLATIAFSLDINPFRKPISVMLIGFAALLHIYLIVQAKSSGAIAGLVVGAGVLISLSAMRKATPGTRLVALMLFIFFGALISVYQEQISQAILGLFGKDATLTGRSYLWYRASGIIADHPIEGQGYNAFWLKGNSDAEGLWRWAGITSRTGFNFHNTYLEALVALGAIGLTILVATLVGCCVRIIREYVRAPDVTLCFWLAIVSYDLFRTPFESVNPGPLQFATVLMLSGLAATGVSSQSAPVMAPAGAGSLRSRRPDPRSRLLWRTARVRPGALPHPQSPAP